jgi:hypothetical protein
MTKSRRFRDGGFSSQKSFKACIQLQSGTGVSPVRLIRSNKNTRAGRPCHFISPSGATLAENLFRPSFGGLVTLPIQFLRATAFILRGAEREWHHDHGLRARGKGARCSEFFTSSWTSIRAVRR